MNIVVVVIVVVVSVVITVIIGIVVIIIIFVVIITVLGGGGGGGWDGVRERSAGLIRECNRSIPVESRWNDRCIVISLDLDGRDGFYGRLNRDTPAQRNDVLTSLPQSNSKAEVVRCSGGCATM
jgi:MFS superfamily sulfate permease-like transporter